MGKTAQPNSFATRQSDGKQVQLDCSTRAEGKLKRTHTNIR